jgi:hypothetical protein
MATWKQLGLALLAMTVLAVFAAALLVVLARSRNEEGPAPMATRQLERTSPVWHGIGRYGGQPAGEPPTTPRPGD